MSSYKHEFAGPIEGYAVNYIRKHHWRVAATMEFEDCKQEAYLIFRRVLRLYPHCEPKHFMALFKVALLNDMNTWAKRDGVHRELLELHGESITPPWEADGIGNLLIAIRQAPAEVKAVLNLIFNAPQELVDIAISSWRPRAPRPCERLCTMLGLDPDLDVLQMTKEYFTP